MENKVLRRTGFDSPASVQDGKLSDASSSLEFFQAGCYDSSSSNLRQRSGHLQKGLVIVFTGDGKGKSSAALGITLRAYGHKMYVSFVQFIKNPSNIGEARAAERLLPELEFVSPGKGFVNCCGRCAGAKGARLLKSN